MKRLINLSVFLLTVAVLTSTAFGQTNSSMKQVKAQNMVNSQLQWIDLNGDGICENFGTENQGSGNALRGGKMNKGNANGTGQGLGNGNGYGDGSGTRPQDGSGFGKGNGSGSGTGTGVCDGSGPKGSKK